MGKHETCAVCRKPLRVGASVEVRSWSQYGGVVDDAERGRGLILGPSISILYHTKCSELAKAPATQKAIRERIKVTPRRLRGEEVA